MTPSQQLTHIADDLERNVLDLARIITEVTSSRPGLKVALPLLTAQAKLAEAACAVAAAKTALQ